MTGLALLIWITCPNPLDEIVNNFQAQYPENISTDIEKDPSTSFLSSSDIYFLDH